MVRHDAGELAHRLGRNAEAVCRRYLDAGRKQGNYWLVGNAYNTPGRSLFIRLSDSPKGPAGGCPGPTSPARCRALLGLPCLTSGPGTVCGHMPSYPAP